MPMETVGEAIKRVRRTACLSQSEAARAADVKLDTLQGWEQGKCGPSFAGVAKLAAGWGVSLDDFRPMQKVVEDA
jgi:transcriptional regulator with XRE-family HTH domain